jgi:hypothetical protein
VRQSRRQSLLEAIANIVLGYVLAVTIQLMVFPLFELGVPLRDSLSIGAIFTVVSILRSYALRRAFEAAAGARLMRGRKPKPTALRLLEGNPGRRPIRGSEPRPPHSQPT